MMNLPAFADNVTLGWNANPNPIVTGYDIYFWINGGASTNKVSVGNATSVTLSNLVTGTTYYFAATTYDASGLESPFSAAVSYTVPNDVMNQSPTLNPISNLVIIQNSTVTKQGTGASQTMSQTVALTGITSSTANQQQPLTIKATSSNRVFIPNPSVNYISPNTTGTPTFTPAANVTGTAIITVVVNDDAANNNTVTRSFTVTVLPPGTTAPSLTSRLTNRLVVAGQPVTFGSPPVAPGR